MPVATLRPNGVGGTVNWFGSWADLQDNTDATYMYGTTTTGINEIAISDLGLSNITINSITVRVRTYGVSASPVLGVSIRSAAGAYGTEVTAGTAAFNAWAEQSYAFGAALAASDIDGMIVKLRKTNTTSGVQLRASEVYVDINYTVNNKQPQAKIISPVGTRPAQPITSGLIAHFNPGALGLTDGQTISSAPAVGGNPAWSAQNGGGVYKTNGFHGRPYMLQTAAGGTGLQIALNLSASDHTIMYLARQRGPAKQRILAGLSNNYLLGWWFNVEDQFYGEGWLYGSGTTPSADNKRIAVYTARKNGATQKFWRDTTVLAEGTAATQGPNGITTNGYQGASDFSDSEVYEVLVWNRVLSDAEVLQAQEYLMRRQVVVNSRNPTFDMDYYDEDGNALANSFIRIWTGASINNGPHDGVGFYDSGVLGTALSHTLPANTLTDGQQYRVWAIMNDGTVWSDDLASDYMYILVQAAQNYTATVTDGVGITDSRAQAASYLRAYTDALGLLDSRTQVLAALQTLTDAVGILDSRSQIFQAFRTLTDNLGLLDAAVATNALTATVTDAIGLLDSRAQVYAAAATITDALGITDNNSKISSTQMTLTDGLAILDDEVVVQSIVRTITDALGLTDSYTTSIVLSALLTDSIGILDDEAQTSAFVRTLTDAVGILDSRSQVASFMATLLEAVGVTDQVVPNAGFILSSLDPVGLVDTLTAAATYLRSPRSMGVRVF